MMSVTSKSTPKVRLTDRVMVKLALLFFVTFVTVLGAFLVFDFFTWSVESRMLENKMPVEPVLSDIDPKIAADLAKVMTFDDLQDELPVRDPFFDRSGISAITKANAAQAALASATSSTTQAGKEASGGTGSKRSRGAGSVGAGGPRTVAKPVELKTKDRWERWLASLPYGNPGEPPSTLFSINDLIPVGVVDGGADGEEVMFFSEAADRIISMPIGTRFHDGWLMAVREDGVVFGTNTQPLQTRMKSWGRSIKTRNSRTVSANKPLDLRLDSEPSTGKFSMSGGSN